jgi:hypothetical protein
MHPLPGLITSFIDPLHRVPRQRFWKRFIVFNEKHKGALREVDCNPRFSLELFAIVRVKLADTWQGLV